MGNIEIVQKAKVAIVNSKGEILTLRRSEQENTRQGEWDWPGGTFDDGETSVIKVLRREVEVEELPGTKLYNERTLDIKSKIVDGNYNVSYLLAATATFPSEGIALSSEHDAFEWVAQNDYPYLHIPKKYRAAVAAGTSIINELAQLSQLENPLEQVLVSV